MAGLPGMEEMRSLTKFGLSQVTLDFTEDTDIYRARQLVAERLQGVLDKLPDGASPKLATHQHGPRGDLLLQRGVPRGRAPKARRRNWTS